MKLANSPAGQLDWETIIKTGRHLLVVAIGAGLNALLLTLINDTLPNLHLVAQYQWLVPVGITICSAAVEALRRFMTDYSNNV